MGRQYEWICQRCGELRTGKQSTLTLFRGGPTDSPEPSGRGWIICASCAEVVEGFMASPNAARLRPPINDEGTN